MARVGHSAVIYKDEMMLVFGGKNEENEKMNDLWKFDLSSKTWTKLEQEDKTTIP